MRRLLTAIAAAIALVITGTVAYVYAQGDSICAERFEASIDYAEDRGASLSKREAALDALLHVGEAVADHEKFVERVEKALGDDGGRVEYGNVIVWFEELEDGSLRPSSFVICAEGGDG